MILHDAIQSGLSRRFLSKESNSMLTAARYRARSFVFSHDASDKLGQFVASSRDIIVGNRQFARAPYDVTYVEIECDPYFDHLTVSGPKETADKRLGYLVVGNNVFVTAEAPVLPALKNAYGDEVTPKDEKKWAEIHRSSIFPLGLKIGEPGTETKTNLRIDNEEYKGVSIPLALLLGGTAQTSAAQRDAEDIIRANKTYWHGEMGDLDKLRDEIYGMAVNHAGDLTNLWAMLLWINQPSHVTFTAIPATRRISGGKLRAYAAHHVVDINIGRHRSIRRAYIATGPRRPPRRHDVRGHWAHHGGQVEGCTHSWPLIPDVDGHYRCSSCGRLRYWIHEHQRGRADIGFVTKEYAVHEGSLNESRPGQHPPPDAVSPTTSRPGALE